MTNMIIKLLKLLLYGFIALVAATTAVLNFMPQFGGSASGERLAKMEKSGHFENGIFLNPVPTEVSPSGNYFKMLKEFAKGNENGEPAKPLPVIFSQKADLERITAKPRITWLGHSSMLIQIDGKFLVTDPVFSERTSPFGFMGPKRFTESLPVRWEDLPEIDAVLISHDHYDHLDYETIQQLNASVKAFYVPLGLGAHLEKWGVPAAKITEADWWDSFRFDEKLTFVCTPARHFSGRGIFDRFQTLWASWVIIGESGRLFFNGDSGYFEGYREIGEKYGPFDLTMMECGQYNTMWSEIHMMPEETVRAHRDLKGKLLLPIHWGAFKLALHDWREPVRRLLIEADKYDDVVPVFPQPGGSIQLTDSIFPQQPWWEKIN